MAIYKLISCPFDSHHLFIIETSSCYKVEAYCFNVGGEPKTHRYMHPEYSGYPPQLCRYSGLRPSGRNCLFSPVKIRLGAKLSTHYMEICTLCYLGQAGNIMFESCSLTRMFHIQNYNTLILLSIV